MDTGRRRRQSRLPRASRRVAAGVVGLAALLAACGGSGGDEQGSPTTTVPPSTTVGTVAEGDAPAPVMTGEQVCAVLSREDVEEATNLKIRDPISSQAGQCSFVVDTAADEQPALAAAIAVDLAGLDNFDRILRFDGSVEIEDLFDKALINPNFFTIGAVKGETYVQVQLPSITDPKELEKVGRELVEKVFANL